MRKLQQPPRTFQRCSWCTVKLQQSSSTCRQYSWNTLSFQPSTTCQRCSQCRDLQPLRTYRRRSSRNLNTTTSPAATTPPPNSCCMTKLPSLRSTCQRDTRYRDLQPLITCPEGIKHNLQECPSPPATTSPQCNLCRCWMMCVQEPSRTCRRCTLYRRWHLYLAYSILHCIDHKTLQ